MDRQKELQSAWQKTVDARSLQLPTADRDVRLALRQNGEPQTLFGEGPYERRERLRSILSRKQEKAVKAKTTAAPSSQRTSGSQTFYTEGSEELKKCRQLICLYAMPKIAERAKEHDTVYKTSANDFECVMSVLGDSRPILSADWSSDGTRFITGGLSGKLRVWSGSLTLEGSTETGSRIHCVRAHNKAADICLSGDAEGVITIWNSTSSLSARQKLVGHELTVNRLDVHPSGRWLCSSSNDETWRYWDLETCQELLLQEGHARGVCGISHNNEGSLLASGDLGGVIQLWDLRAGKSILSLREHLGACLALAWDPYKSYQLLSSSADHSIRIWDLRYAKPQQAPAPAPAVEVLAGHNHVISDLQFSRDRLISSSHDRTARIWDPLTLVCQKTLVGHEGFVYKALSPPSTAAAASEIIVTASYDRTIKLWRAGAAAKPGTDR